MKRFSSFLILGLLFQSITYGQSVENSRMQWFKDAKLGIFIHYGIYSVNGIDESWSFFNGYINHNDYMNQLDGFTASKFSADEWAQLFKKSGARYAVLTSKHHDGVALWKTETHHYNTIEHTPAKKDIVKEFAEAMGQEELRVGLYYSLIDWSHPNYPAFLRDSVRYSKDEKRWQSFTNFYFEQLNELSSRFNPDLYWFDGDWEHSAEEWKSEKLRKQLLSYNKNLILNSRLQGYGDYATPEQGVPITKPSNNYWELCMTMNDSWGFQKNDHNYKTPFQLIQIFTDCISMGGNLLLDIGPKEDGSIPAEQIEILNEFARWTSKHSEAIYGTRAGINKKHCFYPTALSKDSTTLFVYLDKELNNQLFIDGLQSTISSVRIVDHDTKLKFNHQSSLFNCHIPTKLCDSSITVVAIDFKTKLELTSPQQSLYDLNTNGITNNERWKQKHSKFINDAHISIPYRYYAGLNKLSKDKNILYLLVEGKPQESLMIKGLKNKINRIWVVGEGTKLKHKVSGKQYWSQVPGIVYIDVPDYVLDQELTVIAVLLDGPIQLFEEEVKAIESN
ncbi:alpha-L-fucosidase [Carboxylicivirga sp. N1Y90]|uniref:alpha-L-fucosidase n=1 Tax=Carboxylicivirga fragile TaxID=3417571 RepID=UPI003D3370EF|nr:alpha-L-fucosidase [Marinilabiliaceae bacterium N1Y90]